MPASEIVAIDVDVVTMESVIDQLGRQRFLAFDRDHASGAPTVEVAHEALLTEWERLRGWIEEWARRHRPPSGARHGIDRVESVGSGRRLSADRQATRRVRELAGLHRDEADDMQSTSTSMPRSSTATPRSLLRARVSLARRAWHVERAARVGGSRRRPWLRWASSAQRSSSRGRSERPTIVMLVNGQGGGSSIDAVLREGFDRAARDFHFESGVLEPPFTDLDEQLATVAESGADLVFFWESIFYDPRLGGGQEVPGHDMGQHERLRDLRRQRRRLPCRSRRSPDHEDRDRRLCRWVSVRRHRAVPQRGTRPACTRSIR